MSSTHLFSKLLAILTLKTHKATVFWFSLSLLLAIIYGWLGLQQAFEHDFVVQDDARQHIFWMQRYVDPELFPNDLIADYFQSAAPVGYTTLYKAAAVLGIEPGFFGKILPFFLSVITAGYGFVLSLELFPVPVSGFFSSVILTQTLWASDEISSGTPRAFLYPLIIAFIYYLLRRSHLISLLLLALQVVLYPPIALVSLGLVAIRLVHWQHGRLSLSQDWRDYALFAAGFCLIGGLTFYLKSLSGFGSIVTRSEALQMPEFQEKGRNAFFLPGLRYWLDGYPGRSGIFHRRMTIPGTLLAGTFLPIVLSLPLKTPLRQQVKPSIYSLVQLLVVSLGLYAIAQLLLFQLHVPSRYTSHTIRLVLAFAAGIFWVIFIDDIFRLGQFGQRSWGQKKTVIHRLLATLSTVFPLFLTAALFVVTFFYYPLLIKDYPKAGYRESPEAQPIYAFFSEQPKDTLIASLSSEADNISTFSARSVLVSKEHALAYHQDYYAQIRQRAMDLLEAQYSENPSSVSQFIQNYDIDFWLLDKDAFEADYIAENKWLRQFQPVAEASSASLEQGAVPILEQAIPNCTVLDANAWIILESQCVAQFAADLNS
ncbi:MAG: hypothetical protein ACFBSF_19425 [Leptolyngbyaceae cyanobacterium]